MTFTISTADFDGAAVLATLTAAERIRLLRLELATLAAHCRNWVGTCHHCGAPDGREHAAFCPVRSALEALERTADWLRVQVEAMTPEFLPTVDLSGIEWPAPRPSRSGTPLRDADGQPQTLFGLPIILVDPRT